jgi:hypothetical protein
MAVLLLLIGLDLAVLVLIMWLVTREPHKEYKGNHPYVVADRDAAQRALQTVEPAEPVVITEPEIVAESAEPEEQRAENA